MLHFLLDSLYFGLIIILLVASGNLFLKILRFKVSSFLENLLFSLGFSLVILILLSYFSLLLNLSFLVSWLFWSAILLGVLNILLLPHKRKIIKHLKLDLGLILLTLVMTILMTSVTMRSGWLGENGLDFFGVNAHDGLWHLSLIGELKSHFPPQHPNFAGIELKGYHYLLDLLLAKISSIFGFKEMDLYFRFFPILAAALWSLATFLLAQKYFQTKAIFYLTVFFSVLGGSFAYLLPIFYSGGVNFDSDLGVSSLISSLINLQFAFSVPILSLTLYSFIKFLEEEKLGWGLTTVLFIGTLFGLKIYAGMIALLTIGLSSIFYLVRKKKIKILYLPFLGGILGAAVYLPTSTGGAGLVFAPGEMIQNIIRGPLSWTQWELRRQIYAEHNNISGLARMRILAFLTFFFGNLGTKALGLLEILHFGKTSMLFKNFNLFFFALFSSFIFPVFFIQSITPFNIIQFWWYFMYFMSFPAACVVWNFIKEKSFLLKGIILILVVVLTVPAATVVLKGYLLPQSSYRISQDKLRAFDFLKQNSYRDDLILDIPSGVKQGQFNFGLPVIPALAQRRVFLGQEIIEFPYLDKEKRVGELKRITAPLNCAKSESLVDKNYCRKEIELSYQAILTSDINYVFSPHPLFWLEENSKISSLVYSRDGVFIYQMK